MAYKTILVLTLLVGIAALIVSQFAIPMPYGADGYLHIRMADFIRHYGLKYQFHWARYSIFFNHFADKDFLYHLTLIPFTFLPNIFSGAKIAACLYTIALFLVFYFILKKYCLKYLVPVFALALLLSAPFLQAISQPRPLTLVLLLMLLFVHFLIEKKQWLLFLVTLIYTLTHVSGPFLLVFALLGETTRFISEKEFCWKSVVAVAIALMAGLLIHPNFPNNLLVFYLNGILVPIFALKWGLELGAEFFPIDTRALVLGYPLILISLICLIAAATSQDNNTKTSTKIWLVMAGWFFVFSFFSRRYLTHVYPLILVALASYLKDWWQAKERWRALRQKKSVRIVFPALLFLSVAFLGLHTYKDFLKIALSEKIYNSNYEAAADWMNKNIPAGELIFHSNWSDSQYFIGLSPQNDYFVTLDPIYMYYWNPKKYRDYRNIAFGSTPDPYTLLKDEFNVRYGYVSKDYFSGLLNQIRQDSRFEILAESNMAAFFKLK